MSAHFYPLKVAEIVPETAEANSIRFEIPEELRDAFAFKAGQHLTLKATIDGEKVIVSSEKIPAPKYVRYAWADNPVNANLYNKEGLPASPFRTDQ